MIIVPLRSSRDHAKAAGNEAAGAPETRLANSKRRRQGSLPGEDAGEES